MIGRVWLPVVVAALLGVAIVASWDAARYRSWPDGTHHGRWDAVFDGEGRTGAAGDVITLRPRRATSPRETHAGLVVSRDVYRDVRFSLRFRTVRQLRRPRPNPWEVAWVVWSYADEGHFYYLALKPNGWELGKRDPAYPGGQRFLATGLPAFAPGQWLSVEVAQHGPSVEIRVNGHLLVAYTDRERPYLRGKVGLYTEDAQADFTDIHAASSGVGDGLTR